MPFLVQTSPFLGQVVLDNGEVHVVDRLIGKFELFNTVGVNIGHVNVNQSLQENTKDISLYTSKGDHIKSLVISEAQFTKGNLGCQVWLSSLAFMIWSQNLGNVTKVLGRVLELGCGVGLCGLHVASMLDVSISSVVMTDGFKCLDTVVTHNILRNKDVLNAPVTFKALEWDSHAEDPVDKSFDTIIATDCIYTTDIDPLLTTMLQYVAQNGHIYIINTAPAFRTGVKEFLDRLTTVKGIKTEVQECTLRYQGNFDAKFIAISVKMIL